MSDARVQTRKLTGVWKQVHPRRNALHATAAALTLAAWQDDLAGLALGRLVMKYRRQTGGMDRDHRYQVALALILAALLAQPWVRTRTALAVSRDRAYQAGQEAAGIHTGTAAAGAPSAGGSVATVLSVLLAATARRLAGLLADSTGSPQQQTALLRTTLLAGAALLLAVDQLVSAAYGQGLRAGLKAAQVGQVNWVTVGDGAVCARCEAREQASPYPVAAAPTLPAHPNCRCSYEPA